MDNQMWNGEKKNVVSTNRIVDIELINCFCCPNKFLVFQKTHLLNQQKSFLLFHV